MKRIKNLIWAGVAILFVKFFLMRSKYAQMIFRFVFGLAKALGLSMAKLLKLNAAPKPVIV